MVSGDPGVLLYKWSDFEDAIDAVQDPKNGDCNGGGDFDGNGVSSDEWKTKMHPIATFRPHPSPAACLGDIVEINCTSYDPCNNLLYGAAGDAFGCYQWELETQRLLGTLGGVGSGRFRGGVGGHRDYLHVVKTISEKEEGGSIGLRYVITGGEDGNMVRECKRIKTG